MSRFVAVAVSALLLAGCTPTQSAYVGNDYSQVPATRMNIGAVLVDSVYKSPEMEPNVEHDLIPRPEDALRTALMQHYQPARPNHAGLATLRFTIKDASVIEKQLAQPVGFFERTTSGGPEFSYVGRLEVESRTEGASRRGFVHAEATRSLDTKGADASARARLVQGMVAQMVDDVIAQLDQQINTNMGGFVISGADMHINAQTSGRWDHVMEDRVARSAGMRVITTK